MVTRSVPSGHYFASCLILFLWPPFVVVPFRLCSGNSDHPHSLQPKGGSTIRDGTGVTVNYDHSLEDQTVFQSDTVRLTCVSPQGVDERSKSLFPKYTWRLDGLLLQNATSKWLILSPAMLWHNGRYTCRMSFLNAVGQLRFASGSVLLHVLGQQQSNVLEARPWPRIHSVHRRLQISHDGVSFSANCLADKAKRTVWLHSPAHSPVIDDRTIVSEDGSTITIRNISAADGGRLTCIVKNEQGVDRHTISLLFSDPNFTFSGKTSVQESVEVLEEAPSPPLWVTFVAIADACVKLSWRPSFRSLKAASVNTYTIEYSLATEKTEIEWLPLVRQIPANMTSATLCGLHRSQMYIFAITAKSSAGIDSLRTLSLPVSMSQASATNDNSRWSLILQIPGDLSSARRRSCPTYFDHGWREIVNSSTVDDNSSSAVRAMHFARQVTLAAGGQVVSSGTLKQEHVKRASSRPEQLNKCTLVRTLRLDVAFPSTLTETDVQHHLSESIQQLRALPEENLIIKQCRVVGENCRMLLPQVISLRPSTSSSLCLGKAVKNEGNHVTVQCSQSSPNPSSTASQVSSNQSAVFLFVMLAIVSMGLQF